MGELSRAQREGLLRYGEQRRNETRERIIDETYKFIDLYGHTQVSIGEITKIRGVSTGSIYSHFHSLDHLVILCADRKTKRLIDAGSPDESLNPQESLMRTAQMIAKVENIHPGIFARLRGAVPLGTQTSEVIPELQAFIANSIIKGQEDGLFIPDLEPDIGVESFLGAVLSPFHDIGDTEACLGRASVVIAGISN